MKKLATKLTPAIKSWIKEEFGSDYYRNIDEMFHFPNYCNCEGFLEGFLEGFHCNDYIIEDYTEVSEQEFLAEFAKPKIDNTERVIQVRVNKGNEWKNRVLVSFKNGKAICWMNAESIEEAKNECETFSWEFWQELPTKETITIEKAEELLNFKYKIK